MVTSSTSIFAFNIVFCDLNEHLKSIFQKRFCTTQEALDELEDAINPMVRHWNKVWPKGEAYFDLQAMTTQRAEDYAAGIVIWMHKTNQKTA
ncbi:hypothetical protein B9Z55_021886 [Caenorhabditis nigoni]|uniref:Uncharacterized protein n=1 Tax=Caenorhabditis nigoni TaxID=1611254 RepID=A0A2G5TTZ0_9PELO|nr:hypothetical protein B9Z55_021886 [Caenorhabditis nigoni]